MKISVEVAVAAACAMMLAACAQPSRFTKAGVSDETKRAEAKACYKLVRKEMPPKHPVLDGPTYGAGEAIGQAIVNADRINGYRHRLFDECMAKRGYKKLPPS